MEELGLTKALQNLIQDFSQHYQDIDWQVKIAAIDHVFPLPVQTMIFRIIQEGLTNIGKHAAPRRVQITVSKEDRQGIIYIKDDGRGFDPDAVLRGVNPHRGMGLLALTERVNMVGGTLDLWSRKDQGTALTIAIPLMEAPGILGTRGSQRPEDVKI
jgi:signal transduction histidine kinase